MKKYIFTLLILFKLQPLLYAQITGQPSDATVCENANTSFIITSSNASLSFHWQKFNGSTWSNLTNTSPYSTVTSKTLQLSSVTSSLNGSLFRCVTDSNGVSRDTSSTAKLTVNILPSISTQPANSTICLNTNTSFKVSASGTGITYTWQENRGSTWDTIKNSGSKPIYANWNTNTLKADSAITSNSGFQYRCLISGTCTPSVTSNAATLKVDSVSPSITSHPSNTPICEGGNGQFKVTAKGQGLTYQWQVNTGSGWNNISGGSNPTYVNFTSATLDVNSVIASNNGYQYRCVVTGTCTPSTTSNAATLTVNTLPSITKQPDSSNICEGKNTTYKITATGTSITYQWQVYNGSSWSTIASPGSNPAYSNYTTTTLSLTSIVLGNNNYYYRCIVSGTCNPSDTSDSVKLVVYKIPVISSQPINSSICSGNNTTFKVSTSGTSLTYQWEVDTGSGWNGITSAGSNPTYANYTSATLNVNNVKSSNSGYKYRCIVSGTCNPNATSDSAILTVNTAPSITSQSGNSSICEWKSTTYKVTTTGTAITYQWQVYNGSNWSDISAAGTNPIYSNWTSSTLNIDSVAASNDGYLYQCIVSGTCSPKDTSNPAKLTVYTAPSITNQLKDSTICEGNNATFNISVNGTALSYKWQVNSGSGWSTIISVGSNPIYSNFNSSTLGVNYVISWNNNYQYRCIVSGTCSPADTSNAATLHVNTIPSIASHPIKSVVCDSSNTSFQINANGTNLSFQWQVNTGAGWNNIIASGSYPKYTNWSTNILKVDSAVKGNNNNQYRCIISNNGCNSAISDSAQLIVNSLPIAKAGKDDSICFGLSANLQATYDSTYKYLWSPSTGLSNINISNPIASPAVVTTYTVKVTDLNGCINTGNVKISVNPLPTANAGSDSTICFGDNIQFNASGGSSYNWSPSTGLNNPNISNPIAKPTTTTIYTLTVTDTKGCKNTDDIKINVNSLPNANAGNDVSMCIGTSIQLNATGGVSYNWSPSIGLSNTNISNPIASSTNSTSYICTVTNSNGCINSDTIIVSVNLLPVVNAGNDVSICFGNNIQLKATGGVLYSWNPILGLDSSTISSPVANPTTTTKYIITATDANGCVNTDDVNVKVNLLPNVSAGKDDIVCYGNRIRLNGSGAYLYNWSPSVLLDSSTISKPLSNPILNNTTFILQASDTNGCKGSDTVIISVVSKPTPKITGKTIVCKNQSWVEYCTNAASHNINWTVKNGTIMNGQGTNCIKVHWSDIDSIGTVSVNEHLWTYPFCEDSNSLQVSLSNGLAPNVAIIEAPSNNIANKILLCKACPYTIYLWGYESKTNPNDTFSTYSTSWYLYNKIDTINYFYWAKLGYDSICLTKSYFNPPAIITNGLEAKEFNNDINLFPNPTTGILSLTSNSPIESFDIYNIIGEKISSQFLATKYQKQLMIDLSSQASGIYFISIRCKEGIFVKKVIKE